MCDPPFEYDAKRQLTVLDDLFANLLDTVSDPIRKLPPKLPLVVKLHVVAPALSVPIEERFQLAWTERALREVSIVNDPKPLGLMSLDTWLDAPAGEGRDHATLMVVIELHNLVSEPAPKGSAEVGVALLMVPEDVARRHRLVPIAQIHRPMQGTVATLANTLKFALQWGYHGGPCIQHLWHSGFDIVGQTGFARCRSHQRHCADVGTSSTGRARSRSQRRPWRHRR